MLKLKNVDWSLGTHTVVVQWFSKTGSSPNKLSLNLRGGTNFVTWWQRIAAIAN